MDVNIQNTKYNVMGEKKKREEFKFIRPHVGSPFLFPKEKNTTHQTNSITNLTK